MESKGNKNISKLLKLFLVVVLAFAVGFIISRMTATDKKAHVQHTTEQIWTCSMHPQIQQPKPGKCPICFMDLIPVETGSGSEGLDPNQIRMSETAVQLAEIQTTPVTRAYAERSIRMVGKLDYDESQVSYITAWVPGRLDKLFIDYTGAAVSKGDHMVRMCHVCSGDLQDSSGGCGHVHAQIDRSPYLHQALAGAGGNVPDVGQATFEYQVPSAGIVLCGQDPAVGGRARDRQGASAGCRSCPGIGQAAADP